ncbi:MAG TPA: hypothetical protein VFN61_07425, partial [Acidimicrobiales bacterium]|nr:hypothetical protein [Acidimicrobiales bacterium]
NDTSIWGDIVDSVEGACHWAADHVPLQAISALLNKISAVAGLLSLLPIPIFQEVCALVAAGAALGTFVTDAMNQGNDAYLGDFSWVNFGETMGLDALNVGLSFASLGAMREVEEAEVVTKQASEVSMEAEASYKVAVANTTTAAETASRWQSVVQWTSSGRLPARLVKLPFRLVAQSHLDPALMELGARQADEAQALSHVTEANEALKAAQEGEHEAALKALRVGVASEVVSLGNVAFSEKSLDPRYVVVTSTQYESDHLHHGDPGSRAEWLGASLVGHTITLPATHRPEAPKTGR